jgi:hypothetical protein
MPMSTKCQKNEKKITITSMEHFRLRQSMILTTGFLLLATVGTSGTETCTALRESFTLD